MPGNTLASRTMNIYSRASNSLPIGLKTISYCHNSHMRIIVNQSLESVKKSITMTAANPTQRSGESHTKKKNYTCKRRIHDFYVFCIDECKAIILASGKINCYCCCCCILMSRYIYHLRKIWADFYF